MSELFFLERGTAPLLISIPHLGTRIPDTMRDQYTDIALTVADTDWHLDRLYAFGKALGATMLGARVSRYVIDLNRPSNDESLYPGQTTTSLCPTESFRGEPLYREGCAPNKAERERRVETFWQPYHDALRAELQHLRTQHANVLLWEAHSIASVLPRLFDGKLPDLNIGTQDGRTAGARRGEAGGGRGPVHMDREWAIQGRLYHAPFRRAARRHSCGATRDVPIDVYERGRSVRLFAGRRAEGRACCAADGERRARCRGRDECFGSLNDGRVKVTGSTTPT